MLKRMLNLKESAIYSGVARSRFRAICPVVPVKITASRNLWDVRQLDTWLDTFASGPVEDVEQILARLV